MSHHTNPAAAQLRSAWGPELVEDPVTNHEPEGRVYGSDRMVDELRRLGCRYLPMNPGSSWRGLHDSVVNHAGNRGPQVLLCQHEGIAVALAHGYAKATRTASFAVVHDLVGLMQGTMGVYNALVDEVPLVLIGGGGPADTRERRPIDWIHSASAQAELVRDFVKWDAEPIDLPATVRALAQATRLSLTPPRGPTYVTVDSAVQEQRADDIDIPAEAAHGAESPVLDQQAAVDIVTELRRARHPAIVVGPMGYDPAATQAVTTLAIETGAACVDVDHASVVPSQFPQNLTGDPTILAEADLILALGVRDLRNVLGPVKGRRKDELEREAYDQARVIDVSLRDLTLRSWSHMSSFTPVCERRLLAEPVAAAQMLAHAASDHHPSGAERTDQEERRSTMAQRHQAILEAGRERVQRRWDETPIAPGRLAAELWNAVQGTPWLMVMRNSRSFPKGIWRFDDASDYLGHSGGAGVGYGPGAAVGAALGANEKGRLPVGIIGDGDLLNAPGALWTAAHYRIPMLLVVNDNNSFYNDEGHQHSVALDRARPTENAWIGMRMTDPQTDIASLARSYGTWAAGPIEEPWDLTSAMKDGIAAAQDGQTAIVHVRTAPK